MTRTKHDAPPYSVVLSGRVRSLIRQRGRLPEEVSRRIGRAHNYLWRKLTKKERPLTARDVDEILEALDARASDLDDDVVCPAGAAALAVLDRSGRISLDRLVEKVSAEVEALERPRYARETAVAGIVDLADQGVIRLDHDSGAPETAGDLVRVALERGLEVEVARR